MNHASASPEVSAVASARRALPYARLLRSLEIPTAPLPDGWALVMDWWSFGPGQRLGAMLADLRMAAFVNRGEGLVAVAIPGTRVNVRGVFAVLRRRTFGGSSRLAVAFVNRVRTAFPGFVVTVVGHSSGGGIASHVGAILRLPTITFNGARTRAALINEGSQQLNVIVRGDFWGDPGVLPGRLAGETVWLDAGTLSLRDRHAVPTIVAALERLVLAGEGRG